MKSRGTNPPAEKTPHAAAARRRRARLGLYGALAAVVLGLALAARYLDRPEEPQEDQTWSDVDYAALPEVQLLQRYLRIDTSPTTGSELEGARFLAGVLEEAGIPAHVERLGDRQANLWAVLEGELPEAVVLHHHIDVYPIDDPEAWDFPPFGGQIDLAWLYGRGAFDMKSVAIAQLQALLELKRSGQRPRRSVIYLATGSEEVGSELGTRWILRHHPELVERFWAVLTEGGIVEPVNQREIKYWGIEYSQKRFAVGHACATDRQRLEELREDLMEWEATAARRRLTPEVDRFLTAYAESRRDVDIREVLAETRRALDHTADFEALPGYLKSMFRDELVAYPVEEDRDGGFRMRLVFHLLPGSDFADVRPRLLPPWLTHGVAVRLEEPLGSPAASPVDHPAYRAQEELLREAYPEARVGPYFLAWVATDSRFFREAGIPSYGFSPFLIFNTDTFRVDTINERIGLPGYVGGVELYGRLLRRLAG